ncbi:hypothetical protein EMIHUDRAFT_226197 [Emiliania huxleyi CCMP1516]|uniref:Uncharacterized protein n=2 Tax=Emiliania huxleyi TaxID=2903 RepID=A0A0D3KLN5_EMIH1|nr:hypothetical protein EMIHUDRAFT_226197 [Emiliania huxleyi CCMP1516]EOD36670.1 hypothetical protein EMIHUDRAFT_226197 [Emiliania huxleyi CCMP1516]|eukprot:XP_005789099.1 hypothetical protein EMIHUDRAFT_226197 [Emiliania huxleyi CCMP1516]
MYAVPDTNSIARSLSEQYLAHESTAYTPSPVRTIEIGALATACCQWAGTSSSLSPDERLGTSSSLSRGSATDEQLGTSSPLSRRAVCNGAEASIASGTRVAHWVEPSRLPLDYFAPGPVRTVEHGALATASCPVLGTRWVGAATSSVKRMAQQQQHGIG